ncbi:MAG: EAL domain-containing protein [Desulfovibrionaceae bacterium]
MHDSVDVLIVGGDAGGLAAMAKLLQGDGVRPVCAENGVQALRELAETDPAVVVLDAAALGSASFEIAERIREDPDRAAIPMLFVGVADLDHAAFRGCESGVVDRLPKSADGRMLRSKVRVFADARRRTVEAGRAARDLADERERYRDALEALDAGVVELGPEGRILYRNKAFVEILGRAPAPSSGANTSRLRLALESARDLPAVLQETLAKGDGPGAWSGRCRTLDGRAIEVEARWTGRRLDASRTERRVLIVRDVTEQRKAARAAAESEERRRNLVDAARDAIFVVDAKSGIIVDANPSASEIAQRPREEILGESFLSLHPASERDFYRKLFQDAVSSGGVAPRDDLSIVNSQGRSVSVELAATVAKVGGRDMVFEAFRDVTRRREMERKLEQAALFDPLTKLANRRLCVDRLERALERSKRRGAYNFAVACIGLDRFKIINDSLGHAFGDKLLTEAASRLAASVRRLDTASRFEGDEFVVLLDELASPAQAVQIIRRIREALEEPFLIDGQEVRITASYGVALSPEDFDDPEDLIRNANIAMHKAKTRGCEHFKVFHRKMLDQAIRTMNMERDIRKAVADKQLHLVFQPIFSLANRHLRGFEALLRWRLPGQGLIPPSEFIPIAEETGLILEIGRYVLENACQALRGWRDRFPAAEDLSVSVNCSALQLSQYDFVESAAEAADRAGLPHGSLILEITETALMSNPGLAASKLDRLKARGLSISVDDFGAGYSSMSRLQRFSLDELKIDLSFIHRMNETREDHEIVRTIINLAHSLNLFVIAKGVEQESQLAALKELGCEFGQGFLLRRPMEMREVASLLRSKAADLAG